MMVLISNILVAILALLHTFIMILEMFFWESAMSLKAFDLTPELAKMTGAMGANQGLYNGFLAAGLFWGLTKGSSGKSVRVFFLLCVLVAGVFGAVTVNPRIVVIQSIPAALALLALWRAR